METKHPLASKTIWANVAGLIGGIALCATGNVAIGGPMVVSGITNIALRWMTDKGISFKPDV